jgi:hypothetical protein
VVPKKQQTSARVPKQKTKSGVTAGKTRRRIDNTHETLACVNIINYLPSTYLGTPYILIVTKTILHVIGNQLMRLRHVELGIDQGLKFHPQSMGME